MLDTTGAFHWCNTQVIPLTLSPSQSPTLLPSNPLTFSPSHPFNISHSDPQSLEQCSLSHEEVVRRNFHNHVIVGVIADKESSVLGLRNLVMPLRASNIKTSDLLDVVILGDPAYIRWVMETILGHLARLARNEWKLLSNFTRVYFLPGSVLTRSLKPSVIYVVQLLVCLCVVFLYLSLVCWVL